MDRTILSFHVDYSISLKEMIDNSSFYSRGSGAHSLEPINCNSFPHPDELNGSTSYLNGTLFSFYHSHHGKYGIPEERIVREMDNEWYRPANIAELIAYCQVALDSNFLAGQGISIMAIGQRDAARGSRWPCINLDNKTIFTSPSLYYKNCFLAVK